MRIRVKELVSKRRDSRKVEYIRYHVITIVSELHVFCIYCAHVGEARSDPFKKAKGENIMVPCCFI